MIRVSSQVSRYLSSLIPSQQVSTPVGSSGMQKNNCDVGMVGISFPASQPKQFWDLYCSIWGLVRKWRPSFAFSLPSLFSISPAEKVWISSLLSHRFYLTFSAGRHISMVEARWQEFLVFDMAKVQSWTGENPWTN